MRYGEATLLATWHAAVSKIPKAELQHTLHCKV